MPIYFYIANDDPYGCFSNFSPHGFTLDDLYWATSEHYFQAQKFAGTDHLERIRLTKSPRQAADMGRDRARPLRKDWELIKNEVMYKAVLKKFQTHSDIRAVLLSTGTEQLIENAPSDYYWGCGKTGTGQNQLGVILMQVRTLLAANADLTQSINAGDERAT